MARSQIFWRAPALDLSFTTKQLEAAARGADASAKSFLAQVGQADKLAQDMVRSVGGTAAKGVASGGVLVVVEAVGRFAELSGQAFEALHTRALEQSEGYRELARSVRELADATLASVLGSQTMQGVLDWVAESLTAVAGDVEGIAVAVNEWVAKGISRAEILMARIETWQNVSQRAAVFMQRLFADATRSALAFVRRSADALRRVVDAGRPLLPERLFKALRGALDRASGFAVLQDAAVADWSRGLAKQAQALAAFAPRDFVPLRGPAPPGRETEQALRGGGGGETPELTFYERVIEVLLGWGRSPRVQSIGDAIGDAFVRGSASLRQIADEVGATLRSVVETAEAMFDTTFVPLGESTAALTTAFGTAAGQAETLAQSSSAVARTLARSRMMVLGALALVRSTIEIALGVAAAATVVGAPKAALHFLAASLFAGAAALAFSGAGAGSASPAGAGARVPGGGLGLAQPRSVGALTVIVDGDVAANDPEWVRTHILDPIASGGARRPPAARAVLVDPTALERKTTEEAVAAILQQSTPALAGRALAGWLRLQSIWLDWVGLGSVAGELRRTAGRIEREVERTTRRVSREGRRIAKRLGF